MIEGIIVPSAVTLPEFAEGYHYTQLRGGKYRFKLLDDVELRLPVLQHHRNNVSFRDYTGKEWMRIQGDLVTIRSGYSWNGCSPCIWVPLIGWVGTPTPYPVIMASLFHDALYQFLWTQFFPLRREQCDQVFYAIMDASKFRWKHTYFGAVTDFGKFFAGHTPGGGDHSFLIE